MTEQEHGPPSDFYELSITEFALLLEQWREQNVGIYSGAVNRANKAMENINQADRLFSKVERAQQLGLRARMFYSESQGAFAVSIDEKPALGFNLGGEDERNRKSE